MHKTLFILELLLSMGIATAQYNPIVKLKPSQLDTSFKQEIPKNRMPNALANLESNKLQIKLGNNGQGFDLYESTIDGMTIASPDKSQSYSIPNSLQKNQSILITKPSEFNTNNLQLRIPQPFTDSFYIPPFNTKKFNPKTEFKK